MKHGALSMPEGRLRISWTIEAASIGTCLIMRWQELGGPPVGTPASQGFGMKLIKATATELGGRPELTFAPQGLEARITVRLS